VEPGTRAIRIEKLLRRERGERLFSGFAESGRRVLQLRLSLGPQPSFPEVERQLEQLGSALGSVQSPSVPRLVSLRVRDRVVEMTTEEPSGILLSDLLEKGPLSAGQALWIWERLLAALEPMHRSGVPYGVCQPGKLLVDADGNVVLAEPGTLAVYRLVLGQEFKAAGTLFQRLFGDPEFTPPEALRGLPVGPRADVFQSAVLFHRMVSGVSPFGKGMSLELFNRMLRGQRQSLAGTAAGVPDRISALVMRCLDPDPEKRPGAVPELRAELLLAQVRSERPSALLDGLRGQRYSARFQEMLAIHAGGVGEAEDPEMVDPPGEGLEAQKQVLLTQLGRPRPVREPRRKIGLWVVVLAAVGVAAAALLQGLPGDMTSARKHEGVMPADGSGLTHQSVVWDQSAGRSHPTPRSLLEAVPLELKQELSTLGAAVTGELTLVPPALPPYTVRVSGSAGDIALRFSARNRLSSVTLPRPMAADSPAKLVVLYDAEGAPRAVQVLDLSGATLRTVPVPAPGGGS
jgi:hypothetical protein